ncbi:hypothetical protein [Sphingobium olei]|uniref:DUF4426 domain-containing protein n=1 Tax=Sphingobium olei TaxID=420955 RepID=A0ABW3NYW5_9SPHN
MRKLIMCALLMIASPSFAKAPPDRREVEEATVWDLVRVGMTRSRVQEVYRLDRLDSDTSVRSSTNFDTSARLSFSNRGGTVSQILVTFSAISPDEMKSLLSDKYGKPVSSRLVELSPSMSRGSGEQATRVQWRRGLITITLDQPSNPIYSSYSEVVYSIHDFNRGDLPL